MPRRPPVPHHRRRWAPPPWPTTTYTRDRVDAVSAGADGLVLELANAGPVGYDKVKVFD